MTAWEKIRQEYEKNKSSWGKAGVMTLGVRKHKGRGKKIPSAPYVRQLRTMARQRVSRSGAVVERGRARKKAGLPHVQVEYYANRT